MILAFPEIATIIEMVEAQAQADGIRAAPATWVEMVGAHVKQLGGAILHMMPRLPFGTGWNFVIGLGMSEPATPAMIDAILAAFRDHGAASIAVQLSPAAQPAELPVWLQARGFIREGGATKFYRHTMPPPTTPTDLQVIAIDQSQAESFTATACAAFGLPVMMAPWMASTIGRAGWRHYLALDGATPAATAALFVQGEAGWLGFASTLPAYRRRGAQSALLAQRIRDANALGCAWVTTETDPDLPERPNPSYRNILRHGFQVAYQRPDYLWIAPHTTRKTPART